MLAVFAEEQSVVKPSASFAVAFSEVPAVFAEVSVFANLPATFAEVPVLAMASAAFSEVPIAFAIASEAPAFDFAKAETLSVTVPPGGVYFTALDKRFSVIWLTRILSNITTSAESF